MEESSIVVERKFVVRRAGLLLIIPAVVGGLINGESNPIVGIAIGLGVGSTYLVFHSIKRKGRKLVIAAYANRTFGIFLALACLGGVVLGAGSRRVSVTNTTKPVPSSISASELRDEYENNEVRADEMYKDHQVVITGIVDQIKTGLLNEVFLKLRSGTHTGGVDAYLNRGQNDKAAGLYKGETVTLTCMGSGMVLGNPMVQDCNF